MIENTSSIICEFPHVAHYATQDPLYYSDAYIAGLSINDVSQYITSFPFIYQIYKKNTPEKQLKLLDILLQAPTSADCPGFIYGFMDESENSLLSVPYWLKMGRTKSNPPQARIFQWEKDDNKALTEVFTVRTLYNSKLEKLVHALFDFARRERVINGRKRIEWFRFEEITLTAAAVNILNHIMNTIHTSSLQKAPVVYLNRELKNYSDRVAEANKIIGSALAGSAGTKLAASVARDLGIELGSNLDIATKLANVQSLQQCLSVVEGTQMGKQLRFCHEQIRQAEAAIGRYLRDMADFESELLRLLRQNSNVRLRLYNLPTGNHQKQTQKKNARTSANKPVASCQLHRSKSKPKQAQQSRMQGLITGITNFLTGAKQEQTQPQNYKNKDAQDDQMLKLESEFSALKLVEQPSSSQNHSKPHKSPCNKLERSKSKTELKRPKYDLPQDGNKDETGSHQREDKSPRKAENYYDRERTSDKQPKSRRSSRQIPQQAVKLTAKNQEEQKGQYKIYSFEIWRLSELMARTQDSEPGGKYMVIADHFNFDARELPLQNTYVIMAHSVSFSEPLLIRRGRAGTRGHLKVMCRELDKGSQGYSIEEESLKHVGIFKMEAPGRVTPLDAYHAAKNKVQDKIWTLSKRFFGFFPV